MVNINLRTDNNSEREKIKLGKSFVLLIFFLVILILLYLFLIIYNSKLRSEVDSAGKVYSENLETIKKGNAKNVFDFQNRLTQSEKIINTSPDLIIGFQEVEKMMIPGVSLKSYTFDAEKNSIILDCLALGYSDVAKQIFSFKKSTYFADILAGESEISPQDNKIEFASELKLK